MKKLSRFPALLAMVFVCLNSTCLDDNEECTHAPYWCDHSKPSYGLVTIEISRPRDNSPVPVSIYRGDIEDSVMVKSLLLREDTYSFSLPDERYSARARYITIIDSAQAIVNAIDGGTLEAESEEYCEGYCYTEGTLTLDLVLKDGLVPLRGGD
ncbi:MAG: hypothetical protein ACOCW2_02660 [Chitinivibrionales bacterium]